MPTILRQKAYSNHPDDRELFIVLAYTNHLLEPYVTWLACKRDGQWRGFSEGHYFETNLAALRDFISRGIPGEGQIVID